MNNQINWSKKVKKLDENIRREIGIEDDDKMKHVLIKVQTNACESIEPAFIVGEHFLIYLFYLQKVMELFLQLF